MKRWITADWHLGDWRMEQLQRPFASVDTMHLALLARHNHLVAPDDEVLVVGDVCHRDRPDCLPLVGRFHGRKTLIRGNHDVSHSDAELLRYFVRVVADGAGLEVDVPAPTPMGGLVAAYVTHYPTAGRSDRFNLVGHVHAAWKVQLNALNVGVDANHWTPHDLDHIAGYMTCIEQWYDDDVWAAYHASNTLYVGRRGRRGSSLAAASSSPVPEGEAAC